MALQTLTGRLQELCHHGHAQDEVAFVLNGFVCVTYQAEVKPNPVCGGQVCFRVDAVTRRAEKGEDEEE